MTTLAIEGVSKSFGTTRVLYEGVRAFLEQCEDRGLTLTVCTNKGRQDAAVLLAKREIEGFFSCVVGADTAGHPKPHPAPLLHALEATGARVSRSLLIGDSHLDAECAARAGVPFLFHAEGFCASMQLAFPVAARFHKYGELSKP